ncbi:winged helix-turn-helix transcriptional regulator [Anaerobacillus sp. HL2]|nr:winged helix-turn-helix transcriptional regulator [Anaerobacillus sp. HL2]
MRNKGQVITKIQILDKVWGLDSDVEMNNIEIYIHYLRKKLSSEKSGIEIQTIRGVLELLFERGVECLIS